MELRRDVDAKASGLLKGAPSNTSWAQHQEVLTRPALPTEAHTSCTDSMISSSAAFLETAEGRGRDFHEICGNVHEHVLLSI
jgi:hypothetical protein